MRLSSIRIFVEDLAAAAPFYENIVGLKRTVTTPEVIVFEDAPSIVIEAADAEAHKEGLVGRFTGVSFETADAVGLHAELTARGVPLHGPPERQPWGATMVFAQDPSGNTITFLELPAGNATKISQKG
jgi:catechol 2,3-dioxygenase-like lactoylglutathione lyase family enzyme